MNQVSVIDPPSMIDMGASKCSIILADEKEQKSINHSIKVFSDEKSIWKLTHGIFFALIYAIVIASDTFSIMTASEYQY
jgi:hypothetical protein